MSKFRAPIRPHASTASAGVRAACDPVGLAEVRVLLREDAGGFLRGVDEDPLVGAEVLSRKLHADVLPEQEGGSERALEGARRLPLLGPAPDDDRRPLLVERRLRDHVHHAVRRIGTVERRSRTEDDLHPVQILVDRRDEVHQIHPERRNTREPVVRQHVERAGEDVVEAPDHDVRVLQARRDDIDPGGLPQIVGRVEGRALGDLERPDHVRRRRLIDRAFGLLRPSHGHRQARERRSLRRHLDLDGRRLASGDGDVVVRRRAKPDARDDQVVRPGRKSEVEASLRVGGRLERASRPLDLHVGGIHHRAGLVHDGADQGALLRRGRSSEHEESDERDSCDPASHANLRLLGEPDGRIRVERTARFVEVAIIFRGRRGCGQSAFTTRSPDRRDVIARLLHQGRHRLARLARPAHHARPWCSKTSR